MHANGVKIRSNNVVYSRITIQESHSNFIKTKHNSNHKTKQITLEGEIIHEYAYFVVGFVPADVVRLKKDVWFSKLNNKQIESVEKFLESEKRKRKKYYAQF